VASGCSGIHMCTGNRKPSQSAADDRLNGASGASDAGGKAPSANGTECHHAVGCSQLLCLVAPSPALMASTTPAPACACHKRRRCAARVPWLQRRAHVGPHPPTSLPAPSPLVRQGPSRAPHSSQPPRQAGPQQGPSLIPAPSTLLLVAGPRVLLVLPTTRCPVPRVLGISHALARRRPACRQHRRCPQSRQHRRCCSLIRAPSPRPLPHCWHPPPGQLLGSCRQLIVHSPGALPPHGRPPPWRLLGSCRCPAATTSRPRLPLPASC
jgi:hypothetical protein